MAASEVKNADDTSNFVFCEFVTEFCKHEFEFDFVLQKDILYTSSSKVFNSDTFQWKLHYIPLTSFSSCHNKRVYQDYLVLELISPKKCNVFAEVEVRSSSSSVNVNASIVFLAEIAGNNLQLLMSLPSHVGEIIRQKICLRMTIKWYVSITATYSSVEKAVNHKHPHHRKLFNDFIQLLLTSDHHDVEITYYGTSFLAHKAILTARSGVFAAMFRHEMMESKSNKIEIKDFSEEVIRQMLYFVYTASITRTESYLLLDLLRLSDKYQMKDLNKMCEAMLFNKMNKFSVLEIIIGVSELIDSESVLMKVAIELAGIASYYTDDELVHTLSDKPGILAKILAKLQDKCTMTSVPFHKIV